METFCFVFRKKNIGKQIWMKIIASTNENLVSQNQTKKRLRSFYCVPKLKLKKFTSKIFLVTLLLSLNEKQLFLLKKKKIKQ